MVRRGRSYGTSAQRAGRSAGQRQARNIREHNRRLRERNLAQVAVGSKPIRLHAEKRAGAEEADYGVFAVVNVGSEWVLRALSLSEKRDVVQTRNGWPSGAGTEVVGRYLMPLNRAGAFDAGLELKRFDTKAEALSYVSAESSERVESGRYVIRMEHLETNYKGYPRVCRETVDRDELRAFQRAAMRVYE